ncbi:hypothetical protein Vretimale_7845, partial [Volvox reticuliferus]
CGVTLRPGATPTPAKILESVCDRIRSSGAVAAFCLVVVYGGPKEPPPLAAAAVVAAPKPPYSIDPAIPEPLPGAGACLNPQWRMPRAVGYVGSTGTAMPRGGGGGITAAMAAATKADDVSAVSAKAPLLWRAVEAVAERAPMLTSPDDLVPPPERGLWGDVDGRAGAE